MARSGGQKKILDTWAAIPRKLRRAVAGLSARQGRWRGGSEGWSIREYGHHLVEANLVAATIVIASAGKPGGTYDWSWLFPDGRWMKRLGYDHLPLDPALDLFESLARHVAALARGTPALFRSSVRLRDRPAGRTRRSSIERVLSEECDHARHHLSDIAATKKAHARPRA